MLQFLFLPRQSTESDLLFTGPGQQLQVIICILFQRMWQSVWLTTSARRTLLGYACFWLWHICRKDVLKQWKMFGHIVGAQDLCDSLRQISMNWFYWYAFWNAVGKGEPAVQFKGSLLQGAREWCCLPSADEKGIIYWTWLSPSSCLPGRKLEWESTVC